MSPNTDTAGLNEKELLLVSSRTRGGKLVVSVGGAPPKRGGSEPVLNRSSRRCVEEFEGEEGVETV
jgi:hypothetical protein